MAKYSCPVCEKPCDDPSGCFKHKKRAPLKRGALKPSGRLKVKRKTVEQMQNEKVDRDRMVAFHHEVWNSRPHYSEVSKKWLGHEPLSVFFHHILPKSKYPEAKYDPENIILLTFEEHTQVEQNPLYYPQIVSKAAQLLLKYERRA